MATAVSSVVLSKPEIFTKFDTTAVSNLFPKAYVHIKERCGLEWLERANWTQSQPYDPTLSSGTLQVGRGSLKLSRYGFMSRDASWQQALNGTTQNLFRPAKRIWKCSEWLLRSTTDSVRNGEELTFQPLNASACAYV